LTAEAKYIAMSHALWDTIPIQNLVKEVSCIFLLSDPITDICIMVHEDNLSAISMAESLKFAPCTNMLLSNIITFAAGLKHPSTNQVTSSSSTFQ
jgi:hypothetical protein